MSKNALNLTEFGPNAGYVAELLGLYQAGNPSLDKSWVHLFGGNGSSANASIDQDYLMSQISILKMIESYRKFGHLAARVNPLSNGMKKPEIPVELDFSSYNFSEAALKKSFFCFGLVKDTESTPKNIFERLQNIYSSTAGYEYQHIADTDQREWLRSKIEVEAASFTNQECLQFLNRLIESQQLDQVFHTRFIGTKRFSIQGADSLTVALQSILNKGASLGVKDITLAMAHRGRLNTMVSFAGKPLSMLCAEFEDKTLATKSGGGDVKYHLGSSTEHTISNKKIRLTVPPNPSHLEFVNPVAAGMVRAKQDAVSSAEKPSYAFVSIHGDASFAGQGVVAETFNFSQLKGYNNLGTLHIIINNQVGFTTYSEDSRSTTYCSDLAKGYDVPIFHVNSDDPEAVARIAGLALEFRQKFAKDVVIDLICSRKYGHNEGDDPSFTQPLLYKELAEKPNSVAVYTEKLISKGLISAEAVKELTDKLTSEIKSELELKYEASKPASLKDNQKSVKTKVDESVLRKVTEALVPQNPGFTLHPKVKMLVTKRQASLDQEHAIDWGFAECLAYGSLMLEGTSIRISGQDAGRGTFSHRHLELHDYNTAERVLPFSALGSSHAKFEVYNSPLSEQAVLAFDFGYSTEQPKTLTLWEAQFGDFANGAQIMIDQFISSSEQKWNQNSAIVLLLPHGFEGQGPEHSSARFERFLQLCACNNMTVANLSNGAQLFHILRRQALSNIKRPLVLMTPKSMLRLPEAGCSLSDFTKGSFSPVISSGLEGKAKKPVVLCSGKVYYSLRKALGTEQKIIRIEQLYPWPKEAISEALGKCQNVYWVQEEPKNMGAYSFILQHLTEMDCQVTYFGRAEAAGVATGSTKYSQLEENKFLEQLKAEL